MIKINGRVYKGGKLVKQQRVEQSTSLAELWQYSESQLAALPAPHELAALLQQPLPFMLTLRDSRTAEKVFDSDGPCIACPDLTLLMDTVLFLCSSPPDAKSSWQEYYNALLRIPISLCRSRGLVWMRGCRFIDGDAETTVVPDYVLVNEMLVVMRGEEVSAREPIAKARWKLTTKMRQWNAMLYGDLPYILGYAACGDDLQLLVIEKKSDWECRVLVIGEFSIVQDRASVLKVFYNLAAVFLLMNKLTQRLYSCNLIPFIPDENERRKLVLLDGFVERTIKCPWTGDTADIKRLKSVYEALRGLGAPSNMTHLQTVEELSVGQNNRRLVVQLAPIALKYWHGCGYCHGDVRWRNIMSVPTSGSNYWVLIDMDQAYKPNTMTISWNHEFDGHKLRFQHDLWQLGDLMNEYFLDLSADLKSMQTMLLKAVEHPEVTAESALAKLEDTRATASELDVRSRELPKLG
ncbi:TPA: hypothetical protein N0F65_007863 [Lagenidium giganteum]|uniref:Protein kinase domain-containing protein n=1 Tax=Lagenidium giganteum TaxID=4803 RepID=A0AAV2YHF2_9STRA|nr:TPA: hypothetical protein N0F65_007863 [Lagenidium giganteum]